MRRALPSTVALTAFEAAARHQSFTRAAEELSVTQSAVCRQVAALEEGLGVALFRRTARGVQLTPAGQAYSRRIAERLDEIERDTLEAMANGGSGGALELAVVPTFATRWLLPRMADFVAQHPDVTVHFHACSRPFLFDETPYDAAIGVGPTAWPGTQSVVLMDEVLMAVCSPDYRAAHAAGTEVDWARCRLLQAGTRPQAWRQWFAERGLRQEGDMAGPRFELFSMLIEAAIHGMGVALVPGVLVEQALAQHALVLASSHVGMSDRRYQLLYPPHKAALPALRLFTQWLQQSALPA